MTLQRKAKKSRVCGKDTKIMKQVKDGEKRFTFQGQGRVSIILDTNLGSIIERKGGLIFKKMGMQNNGTFASDSRKRN